MALPTISYLSLKAVRTACAVSCAALLPVLSWQAVDGQLSQATAAPVPLALPVMQTIIGKNSLTWSHKKSDRVLLTTVAVQQIIDLGDTVQQHGFVTEVALPEEDFEDNYSEDAGEDKAADTKLQQKFSGLLKPGKTPGSMQIIKFASQKMSLNRSACRAQHDDIVKAFGLKQARVMSDKPVLFQSGLCAANGEIVLTCFGTTATLSPRKTGSSGFCAHPQS